MLPQSDTPLDVLGAVHDFLVAHMGIAPEVIIRGWQNRADLPALSSYAVLTLINAPRRGTNVHVWEVAPADAEGLTESVCMLVCYEVQVDLCGQDEAGVGAQAARLVMLGRDTVAVEFFRALGLSCQYADDPRPLPFSNDVDQWEVRYSVTLHLSAWSGADVARDAFTDVTLRLEDVDVHHPVRPLAVQKKESALP